MPGTGLPYLRVSAFIVFLLGGEGGTYSVTNYTDCYLIESMRNGTRKTIRYSKNQEQEGRTWSEA